MIRIGNATDVVGGVSVQFLWRNVAVAWVRMPSAHLAGNVYHSTEVVGRLQVK